MKLEMELPDYEKERLLFLASKIIITKEDLVEIGDIVATNIKSKKEVS